MKKTSVCRYAANLILIIAVLSLAGCSGTRNKQDPGSKEPVSTADHAPDTAAALSGSEDLPQFITLECTNRHMNMMDGSRISAEGTCHSFSLDEESAKAYPALADKIEEINDRAYRSFCQSMESASAGSTICHMDGWGQTFEEEATATVTRADNRAFSYVVEHYSYLGGAHGYAFFEGSVIDPVTCGDISFSDVVTSAADFPDVCFEELILQNPDLKEYFDVSSGDRDDLMATLKDNVSINGEDPVWTLGYDGITVYFGDYGMGSYAAGARIVNIPYKNHPGIFNADYFRFEGKVPDISDHVTAKETEDPVPLKPEAHIMAIGYDNELLYSETFSPYCIGIADTLTAPEDHPRLRERLDKINSDNIQELQSGFGDFTGRMTTAYARASEKGESDLLMNCTTSICQYLTRADETVFSTVEAHEVSGVGESSRILTGINIDPSTGKDITLDDVVTDISALEKAIDRALKDASYPEQTCEDVSAELRRRISSGDHTSRDELSFTIGYEGLTFYCNNAVNFSMPDFFADGVPLFIPYKGNEDLFAEEYTYAPATYAYQIPVSPAFATAIYIDMNMDGKYKDLWLYPLMDNYGDVSGLTFGVNSSLERVENFYASDMTATYVKNPDGDSFVFLQCALDDGISAFRIFNFSYGSMSEEDSNSVASLQVNYSTIFSDDGHRGYVMTDPLNFHVRAIDSMLGFNDIYSVCCINSMGRPLPKDGKWYYRSDEANKLTASDNIRTDSGVIAKGTVLLPYAFSNDTEDDNKSRILILKEGSGRYYKLRLERTDDFGEWSYNGHSLQELFDGMFGYPG